MSGRLDEQLRQLKSVFMVRGGVLVTLARHIMTTPAACALWCTGRVPCERHESEGGARECRSAARVVACRRKTAAAGDFEFPYAGCPPPLVCGAQQPLQRVTVAMALQAELDQARAHVVRCTNVDVLHRGFMDGMARLLAARSRRQVTATRVLVSCGCVFAPFGGGIGRRRRHCRFTAAVFVAFAATEVLVNAAAASFFSAVVVSLHTRSGRGGQAVHQWWSCSLGGSVTAAPAAISERQPLVHRGMPTRCACHAMY